MNLNLRATPQNTYDAIVIGSGISGGWAAKELTEKGLKTLVLERGRMVEHITDYPTANLDPWEMPHRGSVTQADRKVSPIQSKVYNYGEASKHFYISDVDNPYNQIKPFDWIRGYHVGGRSILWGKQTYRWSDLDFEANAKDGHGVDWPIRYADLAPWYSYVEKFAGISGSVENIPVLPDSEFLPPMEMNVLEKQIAKRIEEHYKGARKMIIGRVAHLTVPHNGRGACQYRNRCERGCPFGAYFSSNSATLPAAKATDNLTIRPFSVVHSIIFDEQKNRATGVKIVDSETMQTYEFFAKIIFVNASTLGTAAILLNSTSRRFPNGLGNDSEQLGHNLMDHHYGVGAYGDTDDFQEYYTFGRRPNGTYIPRFRNINDSEKRDYLRGFGYQAGAGRGQVSQDDGIGADFKQALTEAGKWSFGIGAWGEHLPYYENKVTLNFDKKDKWGLPTLDIDCEFKENERKMRVDMANDAAEMLEAAGLKNVVTYDSNPAPGFCIHEMGTARMGRDPKTSVLNGWNQVHACKNVFVTDGACMTSNGVVNPSLTYMALTARAANWAVEELKRGNL
jgi:choline dehydrogenase-like flavoprotein